MHACMQGGMRDVPAMPAHATMPGCMVACRTCLLSFPCAPETDYARNLIGGAGSAVPLARAAAVEQIGRPRVHGDPEGPRLQQRHELELRQDLQHLQGRSKVCGVGEAVYGVEGGSKVRVCITGTCPGV
jgi:hypothetical protein